MAENKRKVGHPFSDNPKKNPVTIRLTSDDYSKLKDYAEEHEFDQKVEAAAHTLEKGVTDIFHNIKSSFGGSKE